MIVKARGGYCFELNGLYSNLLKSLGFKVTNLAGRFIYQDGNTRMRLHRILKIDIDDKSYISDVGFLANYLEKA
ncbi:MAG: arylamine N-acetyltransferase [Romboutsia sp.]